MVLNIKLEDLFGRWLMSFKIIGDSCTDPVPGLKDAPEYAMVPLLSALGTRNMWTTVC